MMSKISLRTTQRLSMMPMYYVYYIFTESILKDREWEFAKDLHALSKQPEFNGMAFEALIDHIRTCVSEVNYWSLVVMTMTM